VKRKSFTGFRDYLAKGATGTTLKDGPGLPEKTEASNTVEECGDCGYIGTEKHDCPKPHAVKKAGPIPVPMGTRPFGRKPGSETESPTVRAKAPRYRKGVSAYESGSAMFDEDEDDEEGGGKPKSQRRYTKKAGLTGDAAGGGYSKGGDIRFVRPVGGTIGKPAKPWATIKPQASPKTNPAAVAQIKDARANRMGAMKSFGRLLLKSGWSRMHFEAAAEAIGHAHASAPTREGKKAVEETARQMAATFRSKNPRFDGGRFERRWQEHAGIIEKPKPKKRKPRLSLQPLAPHGPNDHEAMTPNEHFRAHQREITAGTQNHQHPGSFPSGPSAVPDTLPDDIKNMKSQAALRLPPGLR
jgi:hypothetical protein